MFQWADPKILLEPLRHGLFLSSKLDSKLIVQYVLETLPFVYIQSQKIINSVIGSLEEAKKVYDQVNKEDQKYDVVYQVVTLKGHPVTSVIIEYSEDKDFDLNIIGSRGHGKFKAAILGSVYFHVFNHIKKPVTLVK